MRSYNIAIIGAGVATSLTLREILKKIKSENNKDKSVSIAVVEKDREFWKGIPYGYRSSPNALVITTVHDFVNESEQDQFFGWLLDTKDRWVHWYRKHGGATAERWLESNLPRIEQKDWKNVYTPRFLYGDYLSELITALIKEIRELGLATIDLINAEATDAQPIKPFGYQINIKRSSGAEELIAAGKLVLSTGSAPVRNVLPPSDRENILLINDIYAPSVEENIDCIADCFAKNKDTSSNNLLIIGTNASSIEFLYLFAGRSGFMAHVNKIFLLSTSGELPDDTDTRLLDAYPTPSLDVLATKGNYTLLHLMAAAHADMKLAKASGTNMDYVGKVVTRTLGLLEPLGEENRKDFFGIHALKLRDSFRRSGPEYRGAAKKLIGEGTVETIKGRFSEATIDGDGVTVKYVSAVTNEVGVLPRKFNAVLNCTGSDNLDISTSSLLNNLINKGICKMNRSCKGIEVDEHFVAAPNLYVMGPLLGGNVNKLIHFWQLENASRLTSLAPFLAAELV